MKDILFFLKLQKLFCYILYMFLFYFSIEGEYVPLPGDEVIYRLCPIPPKFEKNQAVHVRIVHLTPEKHLKWDEPPL